jgi:SAM-dependent methyltransferase
MFKKLRMVWEARNWMKRNEPFLSTWHAYIGYKLDLFTVLQTPHTLDALLAKTGYATELLTSWVDTGVVLGHLKQDGNGEIRSTRRMQKYFSKDSPTCIGELLKEMLEMHIPALLHYPAILQGEPKPTYGGEHYGQTVAATSALIEQRAFPYVHKMARRLGVRRFLDIGCGSGGYLLEFANRVGSEQGRFVGIDLNGDCIKLADSVAKASELQNVSFHCQSFEQYQSEEKFDMTMMNNILHYYAPHTREALIHKAASHLTDSGSLVIITPLYLERFGRRFATAFNAFMQAHSNLYALPRKQELIGIAERNGFHLHTLKPIIREGSWYCLVFTKQGLSD